MDVLTFDDYKKFLSKKIEENANVRGYQAKLAVAARSHRSYFSTLLRSKNHLTVEQAHRLATFWGFNAVETNYFIELVNLARTDYAPLQRLIRERIEQMRQERERLAKRFNVTNPVESPMATTYYSSWHYAALHMLSGLDAKLDTYNLAQRLQMAPHMVESALRVLEAMNLVKEHDQRWIATPGHIHIPGDSPLCTIHHSNWRQRAINDCQDVKTEGLHYTSTQSHSLRDFQAIKAILLKTIDQVRTSVESAPNEDVSVVCIDFFRV